MNEMSSNCNETGLRMAFMVAGKSFKDALSTV